MLALTRLAAESLADAAARLRACGPPAQESVLCKWTWTVTRNETAASVAQDLSRPLWAAVILLGAWLLTRVVRKVTKRVVRQLATDRTGERIDKVRQRTGLALLDSTSAEMASPRRAQRAETIGVVLRSIASVAIWLVAIVWALDALGVSVGPLLAGAGIVGVGLAFGAQSMVRDFLAGMFIVIEDQYGVGDVIDVGSALGGTGTTGTVESITLRSTRLRDLEGVVWHVPNGEIRRVGNKSQQWAKVVLDIAVARETDLDAASTVIEQTAHDMWQSEEWRTIILDDPEVLGVEALGALDVKIRLVVKTVPLEQWRVARELRARIKVALEAAGIDAPPAVGG